MTIIDQGKVKPGETILPLSTAQSGMWLAQKFASADAVFNLAESIEIHGPIDPALFEAALRLTAHEAETVRARFIDMPDGPRQAIAPAFDGDIPFLDVGMEPDPRAAAERWMMAELTAPIDLSAGPLWASALFKAAPDRFFWYHRSHHIVMDGFTGGLFARRAAAVYSALVDGRTPDATPFGPLSALIEEEGAYHGSPRFARDRDYWAERFADRPAPLSLADRLSPNIGGLLRRTTHLSPDRVDALRALAQAGGTSLPQVLIAAITAYLYRVTGREDLVVGLPVTARLQPHLRRIPGMVANALPLRLAMRPDMTMEDLLRQTAAQMRRILRHQCYRYETLRRDLGLRPGEHLFTTVVNIEPFDYDLRFGGHPVTPHNLSNGSAEDLGIFVYDRGDGRGLRIDFDANPALYPPADLEAHQRRLLRLMESVTRKPGAPIGRIELLDAEERRKLLVAWNGTARPVAATSLPALFEAQAARHPEATALIAEDTSLSYGALNVRANRLAHFLIRQGAGPDGIVALALPRSAERIVGLLAILKTGAACLPLDPDYPPERLAFMLGNAGPASMIATEAIARHLPTDTPLLVVDDTDTAADLAGCSDGNPGDHERTRPLMPLDAAYVIYTSGSTGTPKGVVVPHAGLASLAAAQLERFDLGPEARVLQLSSPSFDASIMEVLMAFAAGAALVVPRPGPLAGRFLADLLRDYAITHALIPPATLASLPPEPVDALGTLIVGGDACPAALAARWSEGRRMINAYGPTEGTICATMSGPLSGTETPPIGRPIWNTRLYVLDGALRPVPIGATGEIYIAGDGVARGYLGQPARTAERFVADPFGAPGDRMYRSGDLARWRADGTLDFVGRADHQVKIRGFRVEPGEIETVLGSHPAVAHAAVLAREDRPGDRRLVAYVVPRGETPPEPGALRRHAAMRLPDYMVPSAFVILDELPRTANGKLDRKALPAPEQNTGAAYAPPRTSTEQRLAEMFAETLNLGRVGIHDNFFELGGHSLLVVQLIARMQAAFDVELPLDLLFEVSTIAALAEQIDRLKRQGKADEKPDLSRDIVLPAHVRRPALRPAAEAGRVFLTGATGFLGSHLLATLLRESPADILCLVRAPDDGAAQDRLKQALARWKLDGLWDDRRIDVVRGDIAEPDLGLDRGAAEAVRDGCDAIYHSAARLAFLHPYAALKPVNVDSGLILLEWTAGGRPKALHHMSTLGVIDPRAGYSPVSEHADLTSWQGLGDGYSQSKWVAETLMRRAQARGLPVSIYRFGSITGDHGHALCHDRDVLWRVCRICAELGTMPDLDLLVQMTPVDDLARAVVALSRDARCWGGIHHTLAGESLHLRDMVAVFHRLGMGMDLVPLADWLDRAERRLAETGDRELATILPLLRTHDGSRFPAILSGHTHKRLDDLGVAIRPVTPDLLERYFLHLGIREAAPDPAEAEGRGRQVIAAPLRQPGRGSPARVSVGRRRIVIASTAVPGHVAPMLIAARHLVDRGHEVVVHTGSLFRAQSEAAGGRFVPFRSAIDLDYRRLDRHFPEHRSAPQDPASAFFEAKRFIIDAIPHQHAGLRDILGDFPADAILIDTLFCGALPFLLGPRDARPPIVSLGITALALSSVDTAFFGSALPPSSTPEGRARNMATNRHGQQIVFAPVQRHVNEVLAGLGAPPLPAFIFDSLVTLPDLYLQLTAAAFEYRRSDLPDSVRFVGPLPPPMSLDLAPPPWWEDLDGTRKVALVTQGTLANNDLGQLIGPALAALAGEDMMVVATTGGPPVEAIPGPLPANARAAVFVPFDRLLPKVDVMITNGGYGAVNQALSHGIPLVVAGDSEEKPEIAARVAWTGAGINLGTGQPSPGQIRDAVRAALAEPRFHRQARRLQAAFASCRALDSIAELVEELAGAPCPATAQGMARESHG